MWASPLWDILSLPLPEDCPIRIVPFEAGVLQDWRQAEHPDSMAAAGFPHLHVSQYINGPLGREDAGEGFIHGLLQSTGRLGHTRVEASRCDTSAGL